MTFWVNFFGIVLVKIQQMMSATILLVCINFCGYFLVDLFTVFLAGTLHFPFEEMATASSSSSSSLFYLFIIITIILTTVKNVIQMFLYGVGNRCTT